ncbi:hypothetical protein ACYOEI_00025 [Singulisphaera rosea]
MANTVVTIDGEVVSTDTIEILPLELNKQYGGIDTFTFVVRGTNGPLPKPDPYLWKTVTVTINSTLYFSGDIVSAHPQFGDLGYSYTYQCLGLRNRGDFMPHTDSNSLTDVSWYNVDPTQDPVNYIPSRAGRNLGAIIADVLTMPTNAANLTAWGLGAYVSLSPPTLPFSTLFDLSQLTVIPPYPVCVQGEKLLAAIETVLTQTYPTWILNVEPSGELRFRNTRAFESVTLTLDSDLIDPSEIARETAESFSRVVVRGQPQIEPKLVSLQSGNLVEDFAWGPYTTSNAAKTAWQISDFTQPGDGVDSGTCTCPGTLSVIVTSNSPTTFWDGDFWDQTSNGRQGVIQLAYSAGAGLTQYVSRRIVSNSPLAPGGNSTLNLDYPLPLTSYNSYVIYGQASPANQVWRKYKVANEADGTAMQNAFMYPVPFVTSTSSATLVSSPTAAISYSVSGSPPYTQEPINFTQDPETGTILFYKPTCLVFGGGATITPASDLQVLLAVATGSLTAVAPPNDGSGDPTYEGTFFTDECGSSASRAKTLTVMVDEWKDPANFANMVNYAQALLDSVKDTVCSGSIVYHGLYEPGLSFGLGICLDGNGFTTGWESFSSDEDFPGLPVRSATLHWETSGGSQHTTTLECHNHWAQFSPTLFLRPSRQYVELGGESMVAGVPVTPLTGQNLSFRGAPDLESFGSDNSTLGSDMDNLTSDQGNLTPDMGNLLPDLGGLDG